LGAKAVVGTLEGKVAFVTGGSDGIGEATARVFAREGAKVAIADVNDEGGRRVVDSIIESGGEAIFIHADVSEEVEVKSAIQQTVDHFGGLDCAFNNAGILGETELTADYSRESYDRVIAINLTGVWLCVQEQVRYMLDHGGGSIVNTASVAGLQGSQMLPAYSAAKHGVIGITKSTAKGYGLDGIRVNAVCPGIIETRLASPLIEDPVSTERAMNRQVFARFGKTSEVAEAVAWLSSDAASFVTGVAMPVDAGYMA
jgi:NAD(P)-dependent dehydrogenase (short-subunit alcohol dehydrogenase family)